MKISSNNISIPVKVGSQLQNDLWYFTGGIKATNPYGTGVPLSIDTNGVLYTGAGMTYGGGIYATSTASTTATATLASQGMIGYNMISFTVGTSTATVVATLPASSTFPSTFLANVGDSATLYFYAASTTGSNIQLASSTGFAVYTSAGVGSSTNTGGYTTTAGKVSVLDIVRLPTTDLQATLMPTK